MKGEYRTAARRKRNKRKVISRTFSYQKLVELTECEECGECDINKLTRHHKISKSKGGSDLPFNIQVLCEDCHNKKHARKKKKDYKKLLP